eukprot:6160586-Lingulodinium_polyedra.AAC.1
MLVLPSLDAVVELSGAIPPHVAIGAPDSGLRCIGSLGLVGGTSVSPTVAATDATDTCSLVAV